VPDPVAIRPSFYLVGIGYSERVIWLVNCGQFQLTIADWRFAL
jgi:hypothetical protein